MKGFLAAAGLAAGALAAAGPAQALAPPRGAPAPRFAEALAPEGPPCTPTFCAAREPRPSDRAAFAAVVAATAWSARRRRAPRA